MSTGICMGIDLGTTNSCVAMFYGGNIPSNPAVIAYADTQRTIPSIVSFTDNECLVGMSALLSRAKNTKSTFYCVKRLIGRHYSDPRIRKDIQSYLFKVHEGPNDLPKLEVKTEKYNLDLYPEQISALVLGHIKDFASQRIVNQDLNKVVITVPANFNDYQRRATKDAAKIADLDPIAVLSEPVAACIQYAAVYDFTSTPQHVLVYDLGGGTLDVALVKIVGGEFTVIATDGDTSCGGKDLDMKLFNHVVEKVNAKLKIDLNDDDEGQEGKFLRAKAILLTQCEEAKICLSDTPSVDIIVNSCDFGLPEDKSFKIQIMKATIDSFVDGVEEQLTNPIKVVLKQSKMEASNIDKVIMVGGSTRVPRVREIVESFTGKPLLGKVNADEAIALGASIYGAFKLGSKIPGIPDLKITEVTPMNIGFLTKSGITKSIAKNSIKPATSQYTPFTTLPMGGFVPVKIFEGDSDKADLCFKVGEFEVVNAPKDPVRIWLNIMSSESGITVMAVISKEPPKPTDKPQTLVIKSDQAVFKDDEITNFVIAQRAIKDNKTAAGQVSFYQKYVVALSRMKNAAKMSAKDKKELKEFYDQKKKFYETKDHQIPMTKADYRSAIDEFENKIKAAPSLKGYTRPAAIEY